MIYLIFTIGGFIIGYTTYAFKEAIKEEKRMIRLETRILNEIFNEPIIKPKRHANNKRKNG